MLLEPSAGEAKGCFPWRVLHVAALVATACTPSIAPQTVPVFVTVHGAGDVRVLLAAGARTPCDSSDNVVIFDGVVRAGATQTLTAPYPSICERHTWGAVRDGRWSGDWLWKLAPAASRIDIEVSADHP